MLILQRVPQPEFSADLMLPLLEEASQRQHGLEDLFHIIRDKDQVMSKLLDRIETSGIDLGIVFPSITGMRSRRTQTTIAEASKHVPGMAPFNKDSWMDRHDQHRRETAAVARSISDCFATATSGRGRSTNASSLLRPLDGRSGQMIDNSEDDDANAVAPRATLSHAQSSVGFEVRGDGALSFVHS